MSATTMLAMLLGMTIWQSHDIVMSETSGYFCAINELVQKKADTVSRNSKPSSNHLCSRLVQVTVAWINLIWSRTFCRRRFVAAVSSQVHFVASHFVTGTLCRWPFHHGYTSSPAVSSWRHFVAGAWRRLWNLPELECANLTYTSYMLS